MEDPGEGHPMLHLQQAWTLFQGLPVAKEDKKRPRFCTHCGNCCHEDGPGLDSAVLQKKEDTKPALTVDTVKRMKSAGPQVLGVGEPGKVILKEWIDVTL